MIVSSAGTVPGVAESTMQPRLHHAAVQFEALMLKELLAPLAKESEDGDTDGGTGASPLQGFASDAVASSMAESGALGFARQIEETLRHSSEKKSAAPVKS